MPHTRPLATAANPLVLIVLLWGLLWGIGAQEVQPLEPRDAAEAGDRVAGVSAAEVWRPAWSERYPGCVALALWPHDERPLAVLTREPDGDVARVAPGTADRAPQATRVVGACR